MEFHGLITTLSLVLNGWGVLLLSIVIAFIFYKVIYKQTKSRQLLNSLPGLFTSLGLLGTFVAICNSLGNIHEDSLEIDVIFRGAKLQKSFYLTTTFRGFEVRPLSF